MKLFLTIVMIFAIWTIWTLFKVKNNVIDKNLSNDYTEYDENVESDYESISAEDEIKLESILQKYYGINNIEKYTIKRFEGKCNHYCDNLDDLVYDDDGKMIMNYTQINEYMMRPYIMKSSKYNTIFNIHIYLCNECDTIYYMLRLQPYNDKIGYL